MSHEVQSASLDLLLFISTGELSDISPCWLFIFTYSIAFVVMVLGLKINNVFIVE